LTRDLSSPTKFSSVSKASSKGNVIWVENCLDSTGATGDVLGGGAVFMFAVFELLGTGAQFVNSPTAKMRMNTRRIIFDSF
jgi:hypothetical protein